jgi:hypothetical protein
MVVLSVDKHQQEARMENILLIITVIIGVGTFDGSYNLMKEEVVQTGFLIKEG